MFLLLQLPKIENGIENRLANAGWVNLLLIIGLLVWLGWWLAGWQNRRQGQLIIAALNDSVRGEVKCTVGPNRRGFVATIQPAPEPFLQFTITYQPLSNFDLPGLLLGRLSGASDCLLLQGKLSALPLAELIWTHGQIPSRALGKSPGAALWVQGWLDITNSEYATRGSNPSALVHLFRDLQTRFGALLHRVSIQADVIPEVELSLRGSSLNREEIPALVATLRSLGRAAVQN
jgi:hypothetical protein